MCATSWNPNHSPRPALLWWILHKWNRVLWWILHKWNLLLNDHGISLSLSYAKVKCTTSTTASPSTSPSPSQATTTSTPNINYTNWRSPLRLRMDLHILRRLDLCQTLHL